MKNQLALGLLYFVLNPLISQTDILHCYNPAGQSSISDQLILDWTLGESFIDFHSTPTILLSEGYLQPVVLIENVKSPGEQPEWCIDIFPNPTYSEIHVRLKQMINTKIRIIISDISGKTVGTTELLPGEQEKHLKLINYPSGSYLLNFYSMDDLIHTARILKLP